MRGNVLISERKECVLIAVFGIFRENEFANPIYNRKKRHGICLGYIFSQMIFVNYSEKEMERLGHTEPKHRSSLSNSSALSPSGTPIVSRRSPAPARRDEDTDHSSKRAKLDDHQSSHFLGDFTCAPKKCHHCSTTETVRWRTGPSGTATLIIVPHQILTFFLQGRGTLCNRCGLQYGLSFKADSRGKLAIGALLNTARSRRI